MKRLTSAEIQEIRYHSDRGLGSVMICKLVNRARSTVFSHLKASGQYDPAKASKPFTPDEDAIILANPGTGSARRALVAAGYALRRSGTIVNRRKGIQS